MAERVAPEGDKDAKAGVWFGVIAMALGFVPLIGLVRFLVLPFGFICGLSAIWNGSTNKGIVALILNIVAIWL